MTAANCADIFAQELLLSTRIHNLHIRVVQPRHHLFGRDCYCRIDLQFERDGRKLRGVTADRPAGGNPVLDAFMIDTDIAATEILQGVKTKIGIPSAAAAVNDGFASRVQTRGAEYLLDAVRRDEIFGIFVAQNFCRIADADGARNMPFGIGIGGSYVPNNGISRDSRGDIVTIDDGPGRGQDDLRPQQRKRNEHQTFHDEPSVSSLLSSELTKTVYSCGSVMSPNEPTVRRVRSRTDPGAHHIASNRRAQESATNKAAGGRLDCGKQGRQRDGADVQHALGGARRRHSCAFPSVPMRRSRLVLRVDLRRASNDKAGLTGGHDMTIAEELARRIGTITFADLPP